MAKTLGNAYYSAIINHDFSSGTGGSGSVAIAERGVLRRILSATGTTAPGTASSLIINHYRAPTPGGTPAVVQILAVSGTFQMGTTASTLLVFTPTSRVDILEGDVIEFETVVAQAAPTGAQMRTWTVEVAQSEGGGS